MIDTTTRERLRVAADGIAGPYLMIPVSQVPRIREALDRHRVHYWIDADAISLDGKPAVTVVNFGRTGDAQRVQRILDAEPADRPAGIP